MTAQETTVCLNNKVIGKLKRLTSGEVEFIYDDDYVRSTDSCPLSLSFPLSYGPFPEKISGPYFRSIMGNIDACFLPGSASPTGCISFGSPLNQGTSKDKYALYSQVPLEDISLSNPTIQNSENPVNVLKNQQPLVPIAIIEGDFYRPNHDLLITHCIKGEICVDTKKDQENEAADAPQNLISNEIFMTLIAFNLGIPVPTIHRFPMDKAGEIFALITDRPDRSAPHLPQHFPLFHHCETLETALVAFEEPVTYEKLKAADAQQSPRRDASPLFELLRQHSLRPALDFRILLRTVLLCMLGGADDYDLGDQLISLKANGCRLLQMRNFLCSDIYPNTRKKCLNDLFGIMNIHQLTEAHFDDLARKIHINAKVLKTLTLEQALLLPKIAREILQDYPTLQNRTTVSISKLIDQRAILIHDALGTQESGNSRGQMLSQLC